MSEVVHHSPAALERLPSGALGVPELDSAPAWRLAAAFLVARRSERHAHRDSHFRLNTALHKCARARGRAKAWLYNRQRADDPAPSVLCITGFSACGRSSSLRF